MAGRKPEGENKRVKTQVTIAPDDFRYLGLWRTSTEKDALKPETDPRTLDIGSEHLDEVFALIRKVWPRGPHGGLPAAKPLREGEVRPPNRRQLKAIISAKDREIAKLRKELERLRNV